MNADKPEVISAEEVVGQEAAQIAVRREYLGIPAERGLVGIALSGGGIRSGTFNLGILQGLSTKGLLDDADYLSTVSGGGYIGSWLHGVIARKGAGDPRKIAGYMGRPDHTPHEDVDDPITFLRKYSSYLAPDLGLFSADFWVIMVIWFRNMFLNQLILIPFLACFSLLTVTAGILKAWVASGHAHAHAPWLINHYVLLALIALSGAAATLIAARGVGRTVLGSGATAHNGIFEDGNRAGIFCTACVFGACFLLACRSATFASISPLKLFAGLFAGSLVLLFALQLFGKYFNCYLEQHPGGQWAAGSFLILWPAIAGAVTAGLFYLAIHWIATWETAAAGNWHVIAWGPPLLILISLLGVGLHIGLMGSDYPDFGREWLARIGAFLVILAMAWAVLFVLTIFGPFWLASFGLVWGKTVAGLIVAWIVATGAGVFAGTSAKTSGKDKAEGGSKALEVIGKLAPGIFVIGLLLLIAFAVHVGLRSAARIDVQPGTRSVLQEHQDNSLKVTMGSDRSLRVMTPSTSGAAGPAWLADIAADYWPVLASSGTAGIPAIASYEVAIWAVVFLVGAIAILVFFSWRINTNEFSLHHFYKNRLVRCYLGATRDNTRTPSLMTGFDPKDDFPLETLQPAHGYYGPYPIINGTINLDRGSDLAKQERKGESFVFTPLFCGFEPEDSPRDRMECARDNDLSEFGYRATLNYMYRNKGPDVGTCTGISGAAANPNWGYHTSSAIAFLLTVFDVRLGWWVGNPRRRSESKLPGPQFSLHPLISELFAQTDSRAAYLNISDGGHFENLGVYELVRRGCRYIIAGDGEQDNDLTFESLGGVVRKCRTDFGVDIQIDPRRIQRKDSFSRTHCVVGKILYPPDGSGKATEHGWLLYLKASLLGDEPEDVTQYHSVHPDFPHEPTPNQFFTESQFESYRKLGLHVLEAAFENTSVPAQPDFEVLFESLWRKWYPPSAAPEGAATKHAEIYSALMRRLCDDPELAWLDPQIVVSTAALGTLLPSSPGEQADRKAFFYCMELIQLMENVWSDFRMFNEVDRLNPRNGGWMDVFWYWTRQPVFISTWAGTKDTYNPMFRAFYEEIAG